MKKHFFHICLVIAIVFSSCKKGDVASSNCIESNEILDEFTTDKHYILSNDGKVYTKIDGNCNFFLQYFTSGFENNYFLQNNETYTYINDYPIPVFVQINDSFNDYNSFVDLFIISPSTANRFWTDFVLLSPINNTIEKYVAKRKCIIEATCDFDDNKIEIVPDTLSGGDNKLKFTAYAPSNGMVTSKSSIENTLMYANANDEVSIEGDFYIETGFPFSIIDFENKWFDESPGIRLVFDSNKHLSVELKYGLKPWYRQKIGQEIPFPTNEWVNVKVKFLFKEDTSGQIMVWQNDQLIIIETGKTLPTSNSIQSSIETGITATDIHTVMYLDNFKMDVNPH